PTGAMRTQSPSPMQALRSWGASWPPGCPQWTRQGRFPRVCAGRRPGSPGEAVRHVRRPDQADSYWVSGPDRTQTVGPAATAQEAVAMAIERLPPGCGPAFVGTPQELAVHEAKTRQRRAPE